MNPKEKGSSVIIAFQHLRIAKDYMEDFIRTNPRAGMAVLFRDYVKRVVFMFNNAITSPLFHAHPAVRDGIRGEYEGDPLIMPALMEKIALLSQEKREVLESIVDELVKGAKITVDKN